ncbi:MAG: 1,4-dihydroxy-6-naphthoate synthase [Desulfobacteraceae bacterium]|nr:MAG: 1,4-dihydroxy-6-naphthoate synthase [Desulfobacteraceae bacterium]
MNQNSSPLSLAYSTCPNDTYIFYALAHRKIDLGDLYFDITLNDVEHLNQAAKKSRVDISKLSFAAIGHLTEGYGLLRTGAALGRGCGPLLVARKGTGLSDIGRSRIAVPGLWTTAHLLLGLFMDGHPDSVPMTFDQIMPAVSEGRYEFGVIIHEGRFTYQNYGLECLMDLGQWWESKTGLPVPLGGIVARRTLPEPVICQVESAIGQSIHYARQNPAAADAYIKDHAQELTDEVINQHIDLYVNNFSLNIDDVGESAITSLFDIARSKGMLPKSDQPLFACEKKGV